MKSVDIAATAAPGIPITTADPSGSNQQTVSVNRQTRTTESPVTPRKSPTAPDGTARSDLQGDPSAAGENADLALTRSRRDPLQAVDASSVSERQEGPYLVRRAKAIAELARTGDSGATCNHGYALFDCALCHKVAGECSYGSCVKRATSLPTVLGRRTCPRHFDIASSIDRRALAIHRERVAVPQEVVA